MLRKETLLNILTGFMVISALVVMGARVRDYMRSRPEPPREIADAQRFAALGQVVGPADAPVRIVAFGDYECPFCAAADTVLDRVRRDYGGKVSVVYRHFPLSIHDSAIAAARSAECAAEQLPFEAMHRRLYEAQREIGRKPWREFAAEAGVSNLDQFDACVSSGKYLDLVERDRAAGDELQIEATPSFVISGRLYTGLPDEGKLDRLIRKELERAGESSR